MATLILTAIGTAVGGPIGGMVGAVIGSKIDGMIFKGGSIEGPRLSELKISTSSYGVALPRHFGRMRVSGQIIWATDLIEHRESKSNGKGKPSTTTSSYTASFAIALASREIRSVGRIWADGKLLRGAAGDLKTGGIFRLYCGTGDQEPDPLLAASEGRGQCPAYRGIAYAVFENLQLGDFGNRIPALSFEVIADEDPLTLERLLGEGVEEIDAALPLPGLAGISSEGSPLELLALLDPLYRMDCDASAERLTIRPERRQNAPIALGEAATSAVSEDFGGKAGFARKRGAESPQPLAVLRYYDLDRDYQPGAQRAPGRPSSGQPRGIDLPATLTAASARGLISSAAQRTHWERQTMAWRITELDPQVCPGAIVTLPGQPGQWRVNTWEWGQHGVELTLARQAPSGVTTFAIAADPGRGNQASDLPLTPTRLAAVELPWDGLGSTPVPLILAYTSAASAGWTGAALYVDQGDGALLPLGSGGRTRAVIGVAVTALGRANPLLFDRANRLTITLAAEDLLLSEATMRQLAMGANRALVGNEIIQFASAERLGAGTWAISGLWRGRGGTEAAVAGHQPSEGFVLLDNSAVALDSTSLGEIPQAQIAAIGLGDTAPVYADIALRGIGLRPLSPVHGQARAIAGGSWQLTWTRRARGGWQWQDGADLPVAEQAEAYDIEYGLPSAVAGRWTVSSPSLTLTANTVAALSAASPSGSFIVRQRGDRGLSEALAISRP